MPRNLEDMPLDEQLAVRAARDRLLREFEGTVDTDTLDAILDASWEHMDQAARLKVHVPLLAERFARAQLWAVARVRGHRDGVPAVVFIDLADAGRARMAKAVFLHRTGAHGLSFAAGSDPSQALEQTIADAMTEIGITSTEMFPKPFTEQILEAADRIVTFPGTTGVPIPDQSRHEHWDVADPRGRTVEQVRAIRDEIVSLVDELVGRLGVVPSQISRTSH